MKLQFKHQAFQTDAAKAVRDVFMGQPYFSPANFIDQSGSNRASLPGLNSGFSNHLLLPTKNILLDNLNTVQWRGGLAKSKNLEKSPSCELNLSVEMETGVGKTYTYIKTMFELNAAYGWSKFIVVVPSVPIQEGVFKTFQITQDHFAADYGKKIRFFIYNSNNLAAIRNFAQNPDINVMIINSYSFNSGKETKLIYKKLDNFGSKRPIDVLAQTNPILIIDEPQSVEGKVTKKKLKNFNPLITLRYSATHKPDSIYNMVYRLDAQEAYNKKLVKRIEVKGFRMSGAGSDTGYIYLESINASSSRPTATLEFNHKGKNGIGRIRRVLREGDNLYKLSNGLDEYKEGHTICRIDTSDNCIEFINNKKLAAGELFGQVDEDQLRRLQIRETILSHFERERENFYKGIKTLSLFFIGKVEKYRKYDKNDMPMNGVYADIFEEEYEKLLSEQMQNLESYPDYKNWLQKRTAKGSHAGYFSIDKKGGTGKFVDSEVKPGQNSSQDADAYNLIMRDREKLLDLDQPVRFIFSHSALREGWDNPNVFQICTLRQSSSDVRKRQEIGRGLRLCVNNKGVRMDESAIGSQVSDVNVLTVIASESYDQFTRSLQQEMAELVSSRPKKVNPQLFSGQILNNEDGASLTIDDHLANLIYESLIKEGYVEAGEFTEKYHDELNNGTLKIQENVEPFKEALIKILKSVLDPNAMKTKNGRDTNVSLKLVEAKWKSAAFQNLWAQINSKSAYTVNFSEKELIEKAIAAINERLDVQKIYFAMESGRMDSIESKEALTQGQAFKQDKEDKQPIAVKVSAVPYDLLGKISAETGLNRATIASILSGIEEKKFVQYKENPEDFIIKASNIINSEKAGLIIKNISYHKLENCYGLDIFTQTDLSGELGKNAMKTDKHLYDHLIYDSDNERKFAEKLETQENDVEMYVKLPPTFYIPTPVGKYNPDWAIAFREGDAKHIYFVAETKGSLDDLQLREIEKSKIACARKHFEALNSENIKYDVVDSYQDLIEKVMR